MRRRLRTYELFNGAILEQVCVLEQQYELPLRALEGETSALRSLRRRGAHHVQVPRPRVPVEVDLVLGHDENLARTVRLPPHGFETAQELPAVSVVIDDNRYVG
jgi:hypothetical protein